MTTASDIAHTLRWTNVQYVASADYELERDEIRHREVCDTICRCASWRNARVTGGVEPFDLMDEAPLQALFPTAAHRYCAAATMRDSGLGVSAEHWSVSTRSGYYGTELDGIYMESAVAEELGELLAPIAGAARVADAVRAYFQVSGKAVDSRLAKVAWTEKMVPLADLDLLQPGVLVQQTPRPRELDRYRSAERAPSAARAICLPTASGRYQVIDGAQTLVRWAAKNDRVRVITGTRPRSVQL